MNPPQLPVSVWMERHPVASRWVAHQWRVAGVVAAEDRTPHPGCMRFDGFAMELFRDEAEGYYLNLSSPQPVAFVMWRLDADGEGGEESAVPRLVTLSYNEAARLMDAQEKVDNVPLEAATCEWLSAFVALHYKPEPKRKRQRASFAAPDQKEHL